MVDVYQLHGLPTELIVASIRGPLQVKQAALAGAHGVTVPFGVLKQMAEHPLTAAGIAKFLADAGKG